MRRAGLPLWQRPILLSAASVCLLLLLSGSCSRQVEASKALIDTGAGRQLLQRTHPYEGHKDTNLQQQEATQPAQPAVQVTEARPTDAAVVPVAAPAPAPVAERVIMPELPGLAFLGLPPLPALTTTVRDAGPGALPPMADVGSPVGAQGAAQAPNPDVNRPITLNDDNTPNAFAPAYEEVGKTFQAAATALAAPFVAAASAPAPSASQILAAFTDAIPNAQAPAATVKVADFQGRPAAAFKLPTADTIFSALEKLGRRHLLQEDAAPAPAPVAGPQGGPGFPALPQPAAQADASSGDTTSDGAWYQTNEGNIPPGGAQPQPLPQPLAGGVQTLAPAALPGQAESAGAPQPELVAPGPAIAFGPIPSEVKTFATKLVNFIGAEARKAMPQQIDILPGIGRKLQQGPPELPAELLPAVPEMIEPFAAMTPSMSAEAPMTAPGGLPQPGPIFQALPEPAPLPPLPQPERPAEAMAMTPSMAPETAPAGLPQPGTSFQSRGYTATFGRKLQQGPPELPAELLPAVPEAIEPFAAMTPSMSAEAPMTAPGGLPQPGPIFQALPEPAPLPPLPQPERPTMAMTPSMAPETAPAGLPQPGTSFQSRGYTATFGRKLQQGPPELPAELLPAVPEAIEPFAAMTPSMSAEAPMSAPGGLPQPGPIFQALPEPLPLPPLPQPERPAEAMTPSMAPESAPAGLPQPGTILQAHTHSFQGFTHGRKLQQGPPEMLAELLPAVPEAIEPFAAMTPSMSAEAPMTAPGGLPQPGPIFQALPKPLPLPPLPQPERPAEAMTPSMAPETAPAGLPQPGTVLQAHSHSFQSFTHGRKLQQGPPELPAELLPAVPEMIEPFAAMTPSMSAEAPMTAPGGLPQPGPIFQALPEPAPLPPLPQPERPTMAITPSMAPETAPAGLPQPGTSFQSRGYTATFGRKLQQGPPELPAELLPAVPEAIEPFAAMTPSMSAEAPMSAPGGLPQPGPIFQALPEPLPLPPLPQPERPAEAMTPSMAPETAPAGLPQPGTVLQAHTHSFQGFTHGRKLQATTARLQAAAPAPAGLPGSEPRPMPQFPPLPAGAPEPGPVQGPLPQPFDSAMAPAFEIPQELTQGLTNIFKAAVPNFLAQFAG